MTQMAKILVIEDDEEMRDLLNILLIDDGHQVIVAKDGREGVQCFHQFHPNLVITDIYMPNKDGIEVIRELIDFNPKQAIIAMSGDYYCIPVSYNVDLASAFGARGVLIKPFGRGQLREIITEVLGQTASSIACYA